MEGSSENGALSGTTGERIVGSPSNGRRSGRASFRRREATGPTPLAGRERPRPVGQAVRCACGPLRDRAGRLLAAQSWVNHPDGSVGGDDGRDLAPRLTTGHVRGESVSGSKGRRPHLHHKAVADVAEVCRRPAESANDHAIPDHRSVNLDRAGMTVLAPGDRRRLHSPSALRRALKASALPMLPMALPMSARNSWWLSYAALKPPHCSSARSISSETSVRLGKYRLLMYPLDTLRPHLVKGWVTK